MRIARWGAVAGMGLLAGALALASPASAHHNSVAVQVGDPGECGAVEITTAWSEPDHQVATTVLVVQAGGEQTVGEIGSAVAVGPFEAAEATIRWRVWGGGERSHDNPPLTDLDALVDHLAAGGGELDMDLPGVAWHEIVVKGCEPAPSPSPTKPADPPAEPECVDVNTATAEELKRLKHVDDDRAAQIIELRPFSSVADLDRVNGLAAGGPRLAELVAGGDGFLPLCDIAADGGKGGGGDGGSLPITGASAPMLLGGAGALGLVGGGLYLLARRRRVTFTA